jgi:hypothetical protein
MNLQLDFAANKNCADISLEIYFNNQQILKSTAQSDMQTVTLDLAEDAADHVLKLVMSGKNETHTTMNDQGQIIDDVYFLIHRLEFEELDMRDIFCLGLPCYTHNFNSNSAEFLDEFYGHLGCNGTVELCFSTPIFLWLDTHLP